MRRLLIPIVLAMLGSFLFAPSARAWHEPGHMMTALVAYEQLKPEQRKALLEILKSHPRYKDDFTDDMPASVEDDAEASGRWLLARASIRPDLIRHGSSTPKEVSDKYDRPEWHYINYPVPIYPAGTSADDKDRLKHHAETVVNTDDGTNVPAADVPKLNVLQAIAFNTKRFRTGTPEEKAVALCWLLHLIGDIHQPLHSTALFSDNVFHNGDRGGNSIKIGEGERDTLHFYWDDAPNKMRSMRFGAMVIRAGELLETPAHATAGAKAAVEKSPAEWAKESKLLAMKHVYTRSIRAQVLAIERPAHGRAKVVVELPEGYERTAIEVCERRVVEGGCRLAAHLANAL